MTARKQSIDYGCELPVYDMQVLGPIADVFQFSNTVGYSAQLHERDAVTHARQGDCKSFHVNHLGIRDKPCYFRVPLNI